MQFESVLGKVSGFAYRTIVRKRKCDKLMDWNNWGQDSCHIHSMKLFSLQAYASFMNCYTQCDSLSVRKLFWITLGQPFFPLTTLPPLNYNKSKRAHGLMFLILGCFFFKGCKILIQEKIFWLSYSILTFKIRFKLI